MAAYIGNKRFQLTTALNGLGGPAKWGEITGQISAQADLQQEFQEVSALIMTEGIQQLNGIVKNGKMTIYQGNVEKGQFSANQSSDLSIFLDPPSPGGGGDIPADLSCNNLSVRTGIVVGQPDTAPNKGKGALVVNTVFGGTNTYATYIDGIAIGSRAVANHINSIAIGCAADATAQTTTQYQLAICAGVNGNAYDTANHILLGGNQRDPKSLTEFISEVAASSATAENFKFAPYDPTSGHS